MRLDVARSVLTFAAMSKIEFRCAGALDRSDRWAYFVFAAEMADVFAALKFIGLPAETFGGYDVREIAPLVRRGLWPSRKAPPNVRAVLIGLLDLADRSGDEEGVITHRAEDETAAQ